MPKSIKVKKSRKKRANSKLNPQKGLFCAQKRDETSHLSLFSKQFRYLQSEWYKKLSADGFTDIETPEWTPRDAPKQLRANSLRAIANSYNPETRHFYARLRCFLTFNPSFKDQYGDNISKKKLKVCEEVAEGTPYRTILVIIDQMPGPKMNLWSIGQLANHFINIATIWNKKSHNGMDYESDL